MVQVERSGVGCGRGETWKYPDATGTRSPPAGCAWVNECSNWNRIVNRRTDGSATYGKYYAKNAGCEPDRGGFRSGKTWLDRYLAQQI